MKDLNTSLQAFISNIETSLKEVINSVESFDYVPNKIITIKEMTESLSQKTGLHPQLLQLAASEVINKSDTYHIVQGRYGGIKKGHRQKKNIQSETSKLKEQKQFLQEQLNKLQPNEVYNEKELLRTLDV